MFGNGRPITKTQRPKSSLKLRPSLSFPPEKYNNDDSKVSTRRRHSGLLFFVRSIIMLLALPITLNNIAPVNLLSVEHLVRLIQVE